MYDLIKQRRELTDALALCDGGFPGSAGWRAEKKALDALAAFDAEHPEVIEHIRNRRDNTAGVDRALRMED